MDHKPVFSTHSREAKARVRAEYLQRVTIWSSPLGVCEKVATHNSWAVAVVRYFGPMGVMEITVDQLCPTMGTVAERQPDILIRKFQDNSITIMEVAVAYESFLEEREKEKHHKYQTLAEDLSKQEKNWKVRCVPVVVGDLGTIGCLKSHLYNSNLFWPNVVERIVTHLQRDVVCDSADLLT